MRRKVLIKMFAFVIIMSAITVGVNINLKGTNANLSDLALSNIEILAQNESGSGCCEVSCCPGGCCEFTSGSGDTCRACCNESDRPNCNGGDCECKPR